MKKDNEAEYISTMLEMPQALTLRGKYFWIYPITIGTAHLTASIMKRMDINEALLKTDPTMETLRLATAKAADVAHIIAIRTSKDRDDINSEAFLERVKLFQEIGADDRAVLLQMILEPDNTQELMHYLQIDREMNAMRVARNAKKKDRNTLTFGAVSIYGSLIDQACERYGWTYEYVVWGISYANLQLMLADSTKEIYLTDKERKKATILPHGKQSKRAEGMSQDQIREMFYNKNK